MGIPPDKYPIGQQGVFYAGMTSFDRQVGGQHVRYAELRASEGDNVVSVSVTVIPPEGQPSVPLQSIVFGTADTSQPQIVVIIKTRDASPIADGYQCQFAIQTMRRLT